MVRIVQRRRRPRVPARAPLTILASVFSLLCAWRASLAEPCPNLRARACVKRAKETIGRLAASPQALAAAPRRGRGERACRTATSAARSSAGPPVQPPGRGKGASSLWRLQPSNPAPAGAAPGDVLLHVGDLLLLPLVLLHLVLLELLARLHVLVVVACAGDGAVDTKVACAGDRPAPGGACVGAGKACRCGQSPAPHCARPGGRRHSLPACAKMERDAAARSKAGMRLAPRGHHARASAQAQPARTQSKCTRRAGERDQRRFAAERDGTEGQGGGQPHPSSS